MVIAFINSLKGALKLVISLIEMFSLWFGLFKIAKNTGLIEKLSGFILLFFSKLFLEIPNGHTVMNSMLLNFSANKQWTDKAAKPVSAKACWNCGN
ncbi:MAG: hypothetical protein H7259_07885 [Cytophagales bacterium]|nr:hypothetical protein [Cytophaga sp.]